MFANDSAKANESERGTGGNDETTQPWRRRTKTKAKRSKKVVAANDWLMMEALGPA